MNRSEKAKTAAAPARRNVPHRICVFLKETFLTLRFAEGALLCCGIYVLGDLVWWGAKSFLYVFGASTLFSSFIYLFPVCAAFPYALRYRENRKNHLDYMILQRCSVSRYLNTLFVRTAVSGFAVMAAGTLLFLGLIPVCFPHAVLSYELEEIGGLIMPFLETVAQAENWFAYFGFYTLLIGISGVFWGVLALTVSAWVDNTYAIYIFPILFLYAMDYAAPNLHLYSLSGQMFAMYYYVSQGYVYTSRYGAVLNAWGTFACAMSNAKILLACFVGYILLISDVPYFSAANIYEVVRSKRWTIMPVRVIALLKVTLLYFAVLFVLFCILGGCTDFNPNVWDRIHYSYAHGQYIEDLYMDVPGNVIANYTPFSAFAVNLCLLLLVFTSMGLLLLFAAMLLPAKKVLLVSLCAWGGFDMAIDEMGFGYKMYLYSPLSYTRLNIIDAHHTNLYYPSKGRIVAAALFICAAVTAGCLLFPVERRLGYLNKKE